MTNEEIYTNIMGHKPNKEFGVKGSFSWDDIDALMNAVKNCSIPAVMPSLPNGKKVLEALMEFHNSFTAEELKEMFGNES